MRGVLLVLLRSDLHSPNDAWTVTSREMKTASSPFRQNGDSRLAATGSSGFKFRVEIREQSLSRSTDWAGRVQVYTSTLEIRATRQVLRGPADRQAPIFPRRAKVGFGGECVTVGNRLL